MPISQCYSRRLQMLQALACGSLSLRIKKKEEEEKAKEINSKENFNLKTEFTM